MQNPEKKSEKHSEHEHLLDLKKELSCKFGQRSFITAWKKGFRFCMTGWKPDQVNLYREAMPAGMTRQRGYTTSLPM